ncbi:MAG: hypothetical protein OXG98_02845 [Gemmatimonadetes bacterium]|nr:hypothetical protein [Gemmatimonadota bacterium]
MPLPGGPADKFGNRYETWWTINQLIRVIKGEAESIRIEDPSFPAAEFVLSIENRHEFHQAKRSHPRGKWSLSALENENLLQAIFRYLSQDSNARFVFVSGSDVPELRELIERANRAKNLEEFESRFLDTKNHREAFDKLKNSWYNAETAVVYNILQCIEVRTTDERGIEDQVRQSLSLHFLSDHTEVCNALRAIVQDSMHATLDREHLVSNLESRGFRLRRLVNPSNAPILVTEVTNRYTEDIRRQLINKSSIARSESETLLVTLTNAETSIDRVITGNAGSGKSACILECVDGLRRRHSTVLAFRLDRIEAISSTKELGEGLGLEESPVLVLKAAAEVDSRDAVLIIDQLDAVSTASGRSTAFFNVVEDLLEEAQGCRDTVKFHIVLVCRKFDWENDPRLRRLLVDKDDEIPIADFSSEQVGTVLQTSGFKTEWFNANQLKLLGLPQNLAVFLESNPDSKTRPRFTTNKELYDSYWEVKRRSVNERAGFPDNDPWHEITQELCDEMSASQQLSVMKEKLDRFPEQYVKSMASEGVLSNAVGRYAFSHESFFDYCFARVFVTQNDSLIDFLKASEQHLFRRAQVRQVLEYLRDVDRDRYCRELQALLTDGRIRVHLKEVAVSRAVFLPDPCEGEWNVLVPWIESELESIQNGDTNAGKLASLVWDRFFNSESWFPMADGRGLISKWLESGNDYLVDMAVSYVRRHQSHSGDRVAELLEPFIDMGGEWQRRFFQVIQWPEQVNSRRFFDLFLSLIDNGTLDNANFDIFRTKAYVLIKTRPDWVAEVIAHWLHRRLHNLLTTGAEPDYNDWMSLIGKDRHDAGTILEAAAKAPEAFARHMLPVILNIADVAVLKEDNKPPRQDGVWIMIAQTKDHAPLDEACRDAVATALERLAETNAEQIGPILGELKKRDTVIANYLLFRTYTAGAEHFADDAVSELFEKTWRFECEYSGSMYWMATQLIEGIAPACSEESLTRLERAILDYVPDFERTREGYRRRARGYASYCLLSAIPEKLRSEHGQVRFRELERKFGNMKIPPPQKIETGFVRSPIDDATAERMTDAQWLRDIERYDSDKVPFDREDPFKGGATQLAVMLRSYVKKHPERFARLCLRFPADTNPVYLENVLIGLSETSAPTEFTLDVCRRAFSESTDRLGGSIADLLGSIEEPLPDDVIQMLDWLATESTGLDFGLLIGGQGGDSGEVDLVTKGVNTTRGRAALAIGKLIQRDSLCVHRFQSTLEKLTIDQSSAVRTCVASTVLTISAYDRELASRLFLRLIEPCVSDVDDHGLLATPDVETFINYGLRDGFERLVSVIEHMLRSELPQVATAGARLAGLAVLYRYENADILVEEALRGSPAQRLGLAQVAAKNIGHRECEKWSEHHLIRFFDDPDIEVRREAAICFDNLEGRPLEHFEELIGRFCESAAFRECSWSIFSAIEKSSHRVPGITYAIYAKLLGMYRGEGQIQNPPNPIDMYTVSNLILRTYHQHQQDEWSAKCLDLIDRLYLENIREIGWRMTEYER